MLRSRVLFVAGAIGLLMPAAAHAQWAYPGFSGASAGSGAGYWGVNAGYPSGYAGYPGGYTGGYFGSLGNAGAYSPYAGLPQSGYSPNWWGGPSWPTPTSFAPAAFAADPRTPWGYTVRGYVEPSGYVMDPYAPWGWGAQTPARLGGVYGSWPTQGIYRRDLPFRPYPELETHPRQAALAIYPPANSRVYLDGAELAPQKGLYVHAPKLPLLPGVPYAHDVRVESLAESGATNARTVTVYLRMGRLTELTFQ